LRLALDSCQGSASQRGGVDFSPLVLRRQQKQVKLVGVQLLTRAAQRSNSTPRRRRAFSSRSSWFLEDVAFCSGPSLLFCKKSKIHPSVQARSSLRFTRAHTTVARGDRFHRSASRGLRLAMAAAAQFHPPALATRRFLSPSVCSGPTAAAVPVEELQPRAAPITKAKSDPASDFLLQ
jgi:hypothetical protein